MFVPAVSHRNRAAWLPGFASQAVVVQPVLRWGAGDLDLAADQEDRGTSSGCRADRRLGAALVVVFAVTAVILPMPRSATRQVSPGLTTDFTLIC